MLTRNKMQLNKSATIDIYPPDRQGVGSFDGGKITEIKPIDFPGGTSQTQRMGPLFYWAWASARGDGVIGLHPHKGFEIISYVLEGEIGHSDTLGTKSRVSAGGAQVMQTGSGVSHQEEMFGEKTEFFQIWFEPHFHKAVKRDATYGEYQQQDFKVTNEDGVRVKKVIGEGAPVSLVAEVEMDDITLQPGKTHRRNLAAGHILAAVTVSGEGIWRSTENEDTVAVKSRYFSVIEATEDTEVVAQANRETELRLVIIEVPRKVGYPLYGE